MKASDVRHAFLEFFKQKGHTIVSSSSLVPQNDPTLLFTNSGMVQFKDCFLGADKRAYTRAASCQKSLRISGKHNDFENVGVTARHHTFFEMLGNFSFGDYFKKDAIAFAWEFITQVIKMPKERLWVTIFESDDEAYEIWKNTTDLFPGRIIRLGEKDNFWAMGETGPCGPCSEIHYYLGEDLSKQSEADFRREDGSYLEFWNLVFMQYQRDSAGTLSPLPKPSVDTGMGLERTTSILQGKHACYDCDLLRDLISLAENLSGFKYDGSSYELRDLRKDKAYARDVAMRVLADHTRAMTFLISDGVNPGSDGRGYVLRRIIRRAVRHGRVLEFKDAFLAKFCGKVIELMRNQYPELIEQKDLILKVVDTEERKFYETLDAGLVVLQREVEKLDKGAKFSGDTAFLLHDTYGFPLDLTEDALKAWNMQVDHASYERAMAQQRERSREDRKSQAIEFKSFKTEGKPTQFLGYSTLSAESKFTQIVPHQSAKEKLVEGDTVSVLVEATPFYAESGGQVGDSGEIQTSSGILEVLDTQKTQERYLVHLCRVKQGELSPAQIGEKVKLEVDPSRRARIAVNHSATHIIHAALRNVLGTHVKQAGSRVDSGSLRFDYSHFEPVSEQQLIEIQSFANDQVRSNYETVIREMKLDEARKLGAMALFGEKYGEVVRVVEIGPSSLELCGGTHVKRGGDIGFLMIASETGVSAGVRRIECFAGVGAHEQLLRERSERHQIAYVLRSDPHELPNKVEKVMQRTKFLEKELETLRQKLASSASGDLLSNIHTSPKGIKVIAENVESADTDTLKNMVDKLRVKLSSGVVALGSKIGEKAVVVVGVTGDLAGSLNASNILKEASKVGGGKGGGRADFAQAGGVDPALLRETLNKVLELVP